MSSGESLRLAIDGQPTLACRWCRGRPGRPTILYLHGFGSSQGGEKASFFRAQATGAGLGFFSLDFRGHGDSGGDLRKLTLSRCLADVAAARGHLVAQGVEGIAVAGSSMGGLVGLWHAAARPVGLVAGLYIAPAIGLGEDLGRTLGDQGLERWRAVGAMEVRNELGAFTVGWDFYEDLERYPTELLGEQHRVPSLIFQGRLDDRVSWQQVAGFAATAAGAVELHLFADGDHRLIDRREEIWRRMAGFLAERKGVSGFAGAAPRQP